MAFDLSAWQIAVILATYLFAAGAKGITGLGFTTTCLPILTLVIGLKEALPLVIIPSVFSNILVMRQVGVFRPTVGRFWPMLLALLPGLALGLWVLTQIDGETAGTILGAVMLLWCAFSFATPNFTLPSHLERPLSPIVGVLTGITNGVTGSQVMPVVPFLMMLHLPKNILIQGANCSFTLSSFIMAIGLGQFGLFSFQDILISVVGTGFVIVGLRLGTAIRDRLSESLFRSLVLLMLAATGILLLL